MSGLVTRLQKQAERGTYIPDGPKLILEAIAEIESLRSRLAEAVALLREESYEQYRFTQMTEYPSVTRMLLWHMDRRRRIDAFLAADSATHRETPVT